MSAWTIFFSVFVVIALGMAACAAWHGVWVAAIADLIAVVIAIVLIRLERQQREPRREMGR